VILFWLICAGLIVVALAFVLPPVLRQSESSQAEHDNSRREANIVIYRDQLSELEADLRNGIVSQEQYAQDRDDIERRLLEDTTTAQAEKAGPAAPSVPKRALLFGLVSPFVGLTYYLRSKNTTPAPSSPRSTAFGLGVVLPLVAVIFYLALGDPKSISNPAAASASPAGTTTSAPPAERTQQQIEANVAKLAQRLRSNPNDAQGWTMLARSYSSMEKFAEAAGAYAKATELSPKDADLWAEYAFTTAMANGQKLEGRPMEFVDRALKLEPENPKALQLAGTAAFEAKNYDKAIGYWQRVLKQVPANSEVAETINSRIEQAKSLAANKQP
jgi:cytochrome c-type biogenesis protein CcmH